VATVLPLILILCLVPSSIKSAEQTASPTNAARTPPSLEETRLMMGKWIETQQIISRERKDWQQGKEILAGRLELVKKEIAALDEKSKQAQSSVAEADKKRNDLLAENEQLKTAGAQLAEAVTAMEGEVRRLFKQLPEPIQTKLQPLYQRIPEDPAKTRVSVAERFQNVLGILNEVNKANNEIAVSYEVHNLADGKPSEVKVVYVGLAQAYYVSAHGEAGIGRPTADGWKWEPSQAIARQILTVLEILQGKGTPAFVPLPAKLQKKP
jgi:FtsZ-binding cell division protein ZapB